MAEGSATKWTEANRALVLSLAADGLSVKDIAIAARIREPTLRMWITKGNKEEEGEHRDFAIALDAARAKAAKAKEDAKDADLDWDGLKKLVATSARRGSVAAQKLYKDMIDDERRRNEEADDEETEEPLDGLDDLAGRRAA